jgi:hypothetical protein
MIIESRHPEKEFRSPVNMPCMLRKHSLCDRPHSGVSCACGERPACAYIADFFLGKGDASAYRRTDSKISLLALSLDFTVKRRQNARGSPVGDCATLSRESHVGLYCQDFEVHLEVGRLISVQ